MLAMIMIKEAQAMIIYILTQLSYFVIPTCRATY